MVEKQRILVTGASGYIGGRLVPELLAEGYDVRAMARSPKKLVKRQWDPNKVEIVAGDVLKPETLDEALRGVDVAYYLIHSMTTSSSSFEEKDRVAAENFSHACARNGVKRIIYLGGLGSKEGQLSKHLQSRHDTGQALRVAGVPVCEFRSAIVVGSGSASFEIIRDLVRRIPVMITPRWVQSKCEPISIRQLLGYLIGALKEPRTEDGIFEVGNGEVLTYEQMMRQCAEVMGRRIWIIPTPVLSPRLSSYWLNLVTAVPTSLARPLVESLRNDVICQDRRVEEWIPTTNLSFKEAVRRALEREAEDFVISRWTDATTNAMAWKTPDEGSFSFVDHYETRIGATPEDVYTVFSRVGGQHGWFHANWLWWLRAVMDRVIGGVGMRRGRPKRTLLEVGDPIDFWRVEDVEENKKLMLRAEMKLPGVARLQFEAKPNGSKTIFSMTARFWPDGLFGRLYWYAVVPLHYYVFGGMLREVARASLEQAELTQPQS